jgi:hypothetical protein
LFLGKGHDFPTLADVLKMSNIEHLSNCRNVALCGGENQGTHPETVFSVPYPTCGAATEEACEPPTGGLRNEPHRDRKLSAAEAVETKPGKGRPFLSGIGRS